MSKPTQFRPVLFKENMEALGLPVAPTWFGSTSSTLGSIGALVSLLEKLGPRVTVRELILAGSVGELVLGAIAFLASIYLGGAIGSAAVATGRYLACGTSLSDVLVFASRHHLSTPDIRTVLIRNPIIYDTKRTNRRSFTVLAAAHGRAAA